MAPDDLVYKMYWQRERELLSSSLSLINAYLSPRFLFFGGINVYGKANFSSPFLIVDIFPLGVSLSRYPISPDSGEFGDGFSRKLYLTPSSVPVHPRRQKEPPSSLGEDLARVGIVLLGKKVSIPSVGDFPFFVEETPQDMGYLLYLLLPSHRGRVAVPFFSVKRSLYGDPKAKIFSLYKF